EEVGDAADGVLGGACEVDPAVAVEIDGVVANAARHELGQADRAGVRAPHRVRIDAGVARAHEELLELAPEEVRPAREVERQRREGGRDREAARVSPVDGLDTDDADDDLLGHAVARARARDRRLVLEPEPKPGLDAGAVHEALPIVLPRTARRRPRRRVHQLEDAWYRIERGDQPAQFGRGEAVLAGQPIDEGLDLRPARERLERGTGAGGRAAGQQAGGDRDGPEKTGGAADA